MTPAAPHLTGEPFREPLRVTLVRTVGIAAVAGGIAALLGGRTERWPWVTLLALWYSFGGHWVEVWFLNWLRPRLQPGGALLRAARVVTWFVGGIALGLGMVFTARLLSLTTAPRPSWWLGGLFLVGVELVVHLALRLRGRPSFYDARG